VEALLRKLGGTVVEPQQPTSSELERAGGGRRLCILLAEDSAVNQRLAVRLLEKRGYAVVATGNGQEALEALEEQSFDLVLMDVQMPVMGGVEATAAIRTKEGETGGHIPIVAMTAHAMKGDRDRCIEAGMDSYMSKPIQPQRLYEVIETLVKTSVYIEGLPQPALGEGQSPTGDGVAVGAFNPEVALEYHGGDEEFLKEIARMFIECHHKMMSDIEEAIGRGDVKGLARNAHVLKGTVSSLAARRAADITLQLELMGSSGETGGAAATFLELETEVGRLCRALTTLIGEKEYDYP
jgi:CheY-like chemotaxis protein